MPKLRHEARNVFGLMSVRPRGGRMMGATEREVLEALRAHAVQSKSRGRWAEVNPWDAYPDLTANLSEEGFRGVLRTLEFSRCYVELSPNLGDGRLGQAAALA